MAWTTPLTAVSNAALTAAQWNASVRDNLLETAAAKATASGRLIVPSGTNTLAERIPTAAVVNTTQTTALTSYSNLATSGPSVTVTTGIQAFITLTCGMFNDTVNAESFMGFIGTGATSITATDPEAVRHTSATVNAQVVSTWAYVYPLTAGSQTFLAKYKVSSGTGSWFDRRLSVIPF